MDVVLKYLTEAMSEFTDYPRWLFWVTMIGVVVLTQLVKLPIKKLTSKIADEKIRRLVNISIMFVPIAFGFVFGGLYTLVPYKFSVDICLRWGTISQVIYAFLERLIVRFKSGAKIDNETVAEDFIGAQKDVENADDKFNQLVDRIVPQNKDEQNVDKK